VLTIAYLDLISSSQDHMSGGSFNFSHILFRTPTYLYKNSFILREKTLNLETHSQKHDNVNTYILDPSNRYQVKG
jgi:hypothetical protein